ncbi:hypothetical protein BDY24DRAFT_409105 [Mrakia frigida]|uniref:uncharacterized protein n=1 Tax=Mrakia frigida TaxID=29902 RepID=UPI003FCBF4E1
MITALTHNIPWFLRDPAVAIIGEKCYTTLIYDFDILDGPCLKYALSKGLGLGIVLGGAIVKLPQIHKITSTKSAHGLSLPSYILETLGYAISLSYAFRSNFPFSTYGENVFMAAQNVVITLLIVQFGEGALGGRALTQERKGKRGKVVLTGVAMALVGYVLSNERVLPFSALKFLQACTVPISLLSKAPQIISNHRLKSTGNLSSFAVFNALLGCLARVFTTLTEVKDPLVMWGFLLAAALNAVIAAQMVLYWNNSSAGGLKEGNLGASSSEREKLREVEERSVGVPPSPTVGGGPGLGGVPAKKWARKVD